MVKFLTASVLLALAFAAPQFELAASQHQSPPGKNTNLASSKSASDRGLLLPSLSLRDRIAQMIIVRGYGDYPSSRNTEYQRFVRWIEQDHVGGFIVAGRIQNGNVINAQPFEMAALINHLQRRVKTPLLVASDFERGASARVAGTPRFPYQMAFGAAHNLNLTKAFGAATAREARALGVNWVFAPDADVNNNPDNPIINTRSFGESADQVSDHVAAFIDGSHSNPRTYVLATAKHFPGHGDTAEDSHMQAARLSQPRERIESVELKPFRTAVRHGVDAIMTAHMVVPAFDTDLKPATLSANILTGLLRTELQFPGLVVTDALEMQAITSAYSQGEAAVRAVEAGADVLLMPTDPGACIRAVTEAVSKGRLSKARINSSVEKILAAKRKVGLFRPHSVTIESLSDNLDRPDTVDLAQQVANEAVTLVRDNAHLFPAPSPSNACLVVLGESAFTQRGETITVELQRGGLQNLKIYVVTPAMSDRLLAMTAQDTAQCGQIYAAAFVTVAANRGSVSLQGGLNGFLNQLIHGPVPVALIALGNPYLLREFPDVSTYATTFSTTQSSEIAAARAILGTIAIGGSMPVSIPGLVKIGDGLRVPARPHFASNRAE